MLSASIYTSEQRRMNIYEVSKTGKKTFYVNK